MTQKSTSERRKRGVCCCQCCFMVLLWLILIVIVLLMFGLLSPKQSSSQSLPKPSDTKSINFSRCIEQWPQSLFQLQWNGSTCASINATDECFSNIHCCWNSAGKSCIEYNYESDCSTFLTSDECLKLDFCVWRNESNVVGCRGGWQMQELEVLRRYDSCRVFWESSAFNRSLRCSDLSTNKASCKVQPGCCFDEESQKCTMAILSPECDDRSSETSCQPYVLPHRRPYLCQWNETNCVRRDIDPSTDMTPSASPRPSTASPQTTSRPVYTRFPTYQRPTQP
jgi:hypothetical protein